MMQREFGIWVSFIIAVILLISMPGWIGGTDDQPERTRIDQGELNFPEQVCDSVPLGNPGGLSFTEAMICVREDMELVVNAGHLKDEQYNKLIQPVLDSLRTLAVEKGIREAEQPYWRD